MTKGHIYSPEEIEGVAASGRIVARVCDALRQKIRVGVTLARLDAYARRLTHESGAEPAFLGYRPAGAARPYPAALCTSLNDVIVHGVPTDYALRDGDVLKIDFGVRYKRFFSDAAFTIGVGSISGVAARLIAAAERALRDAIQEARAGNTLGDIGWRIHKTVTSQGFAVAQGLTGHGIGYALHEEPSVHNYGERGMGMRLVPGMIFAIEPMITSGESAIIQRKDDAWATKDGSISAHFEHTVAVTEADPRVLTE